MQKNGESVDHFVSWMEILFLQVDKLGYESVKDLKLAFCQRGILQGAYHIHSSLAYFTEKLQNAEIEFQSWANLNDFHKQIAQVFRNQKVYKDGKMKSFSSHQGGEARAASGVFGGTFDKISTCSTQEEADAVMKTTDCPICRLPKGHAKSHHITTCPFISKMGLKVKYDKSTDQRRTDYERSQH